MTSLVERARDLFSHRDASQGGASVPTLSEQKSTCIVDITDRDLVHFMMALQRYDDKELLARVEATGVFDHGLTLDERSSRYLQALRIVHPEMDKKGLIG